MELAFATLAASLAGAFIQAFQLVDRIGLSGTNMTSKEPTGKSHIGIDEHVSAFAICPATHRQEGVLL